MKITKLIGSAVGAAMVLAVLAPNAAQAQNFQFQCPGCTVTGNQYSMYLYEFEVGPSGAYFDVYYTGTATGNIIAYFYTETDGGTTGKDGDAMGAGSVYYQVHMYNPDPQPNTLFASNVLFGAGTYYVGATDEEPCFQGGGNAQGCNVVVKLRGAGEPPPTDPVPEPATMLLIGTGLAGVMGARRRRAQAAE